MKKLLVTGFSMLCFPLLAQVLQPLGNGLPSKVVASFAAGNDYLALFHDSSVNPVQYTVARWNGAYWSYYPGLKTPTIISSVNGEKYHFNSVVLYKDTMYVGAYIEAAQDVMTPVDHLYKWDGNAWVVMKNTIQSRNFGIMAMTVFDDKMIVAGRFQNTLGMGIVDNIAAYDGADWDFLGSSATEQGTDGEIRSLVTEGNRLYIGGDFQKFAGTVTGNIAYYTASNPTWGGIGSPFSGWVEELASYNGVLAAIGRQSLASASEVRTFKSSTWSQPISFSDFSVSEATTIAGAKEYLLIGGNFVIYGGGASVLRYENDSLFLTGNKIQGEFRLGQRGSEAFIWGGFSEQNSGINYISKIETYAGEVTGFLYFDKDQNSSQDVGEFGLKNVLIRFEDAAHNVFFAITNHDGKFAIALPEGNYAITPYPGLHWINSSSSNYAVKIRKGRYSFLSLGQYMSPNTQDLELHLGAATPPTINAGDKVRYVITLKNTGITTLNGPTIHFTHDSRLLSFNSKPVADNYDGSRFEATYTILDLKPGESRLIEIWLNLPAGAIAEDKFTCDLKTGSLFTSNDAYTSDNFDTLLLGTVEGKAGSVYKVGPADDIANISVTRLDYSVNFTNTSKEVVNRVVLMDTIDQNLPLRRAQVYSLSSTNASWYPVGNILVAVFENLNLNTQEMDPSASTGYAKYFVELSEPLHHNDKVYNRATCDFDSKWFGTSNTVAVTMLDPNIGIRYVESNTLKVYPNPATNVIRVQFHSKFNGPVMLMDNSGRVVREWKISGTEATLNTEGINSGVYFLQCADGATVLTISR